MSSIFKAAFAKEFAADLAASKSLQAMINRGITEWELQMLASEDLTAERRGNRKNPLFPRLRSLMVRMDKEKRNKPNPRRGGMGTTFTAAPDPLASIIGALAGVAGAAITVTQNRRIADDQKDAAEAQLAQARIALEQQKLAVAAQQAAFQASGGVAPAQESTISKLAVPAAVVAVGAVGLKVAGVI
jgi:hypothetical protein